MNRGKCLLVLYLFISLKIFACEEEAFTPLLEAIQKQIVVTIKDSSLRSTDQKKDTQKKIPIIGITGCAGVGKTTFTRNLAKRLQNEKINSVILRMDDFLIDSKLREKIGKECHPDLLQHQKLHAVFSKILACEKEIIKPSINQITWERSEENLSLVGVDIILFEGIYALSKTPPVDYFQYIDLGIFIESSLDNIREWKWGRELVKKYPRTEERFIKHWNEVVVDYFQFTLPTKDFASFVIWKDKDHHGSIKKGMQEQEQEISCVH